MPQRTEGRGVSREERLLAGCGPWEGRERDNDGWRSRDGASSVTDDDRPAADDQPTPATGDSGSRPGTDDERLPADQQHLRESECFGVRDREQRSPRVHGRKPASGATVKLQLRRTAVANDFDVAPQHVP
jgi:hypothetical protein